MRAAVNAAALGLPHVLLLVLPAALAVTALPLLTAIAQPPEVASGQVPRQPPVLRPEADHPLN
jgi:hypothetical protein